MLRTKGRKKRPTQSFKTRYWMNERIRALRVMVIDEAGKALGEMETPKAIAVARERELDLVEVFPKASPPVCKILNYGQFQYQQSRKNQSQNVRKTETKGIRISFKIGKHDLDMRQNQAIKFLTKGDKVKVEMILRGREKAFTKDAVEKVTGFINSINQESQVIIEAPAKRAGNQISALIAPSGKAQNRPEKEANE